MGHSIKTIIVIENLNLILKQFLTKLFYFILRIMITFEISYYNVDYKFSRVAFQSELPKDNYHLFFVLKTLTCVLIEWYLWGKSP